jgi:hypothetical protein
MEEKKPKKLKLNLQYRIRNEDEMYIGKLVYCNDSLVELQIGSEFKIFSTYRDRWVITYMPLEEGLE